MIRGSRGRSGVATAVALCLAGLLLSLDGRPGGPAAGAAPGARAAKPPNVVLYGIDTLRADHLGCYGYPIPTTPRIDAFAREAVLFENAYSPSSWTRPAIVSLFTGLGPRAHGVNGRLSRLDEEAVTLAERLREAGYETAAFVTNSVLHERFGVAQGFGRWELFRETNGPEMHRLSDELVEAAAAWLRTPRDRPFLLYLHATDPHAPYTPREPFRTALAEGVDPALGEKPRIDDVILSGAAAAPHRDALVRLYDGEVAFADAGFGRFVDALDEAGLAESTLVVLLSDHGEEFLDHGGWTHGQTLYEEQLRVPLLVRLPGAGRQGSRIGAPVSLVDVFPTIADLAGIDPPAGIDGRSLTGAIRGRDLPRREMFPYLDYPPWRLEALISGELKIIRPLPPNPEGEPELFDLANDPGERRDLADEQPSAVGRLLASLERRGPVPPPDGAPAEVDPGTTERLRALGYLP